MTPPELMAIERELSEIEHELGELFADVDPDDAKEFVDEMARLESEAE